jgi:hypothetical protein
MDNCIPHGSPKRHPQDTAKEFDALWECSKERAKSRPGLNLEELKAISSSLRRMARLNTPEGVITRTK